MPTAPRHPCRRCGALVPGGQRCGACERQRKAAFDQQRGDDRWFYATPEWRRLRARVLLEEPTCHCGCGRPSDQVDHIVSRRARPDLELERSNVRAFARSCHSRRTARDQGFARG
jgi:5-methylcytosine-specific restriction protein A